MNAPATVDLSDGQSFAQGFPHAFFTWLRAEQPMYWHAPTARTPDGEGFWVLSRYADIDAVIMDPATYSSNTGGARTAGGTGIKDEPTAGKVLNHTDDPHHRRLRELANKGFTVRAVAALEDELRRRARVICARLRADTEFDFAHAVARELPTQAICILLGVPEEDRLELCDLVDRGIETPSDSVIASEPLRALRRYAQQLIERKRAAPGDDIFSTIVHARFDADGSTLNDFELRSFFALLFPAGAETTTRAIGGGMLALIEHPEAWARLRADPALVPKAVEEMVRWTTPSAYKRRTVTREVTLLDQRLVPGDKVTFWEMSANRDERVFAKPFEFDVGRSPNRHLGFGAGVHFCLGAALARLEMKVMFEELLTCGLDFELAGTPAYMPNNRLIGLKSLPVRAHTAVG